MEPGTISAAGGESSSAPIGEEGEAGDQGELAGAEGLDEGGEEGFAWRSFLLAGFG